MHNQFENSNVSVFQQNWQFYLIEVESLLSHRPFGPTFGPILVKLTHFVTVVSSNNLMYALVVVSILKELIESKSRVSTFKICCLGLIWPDLAQFGQYKSM